MNFLFGNAGNNTVDGGAGTDTMEGRAGNDTYIVDATADVVTEALGGGTADTVQSAAISLNLANYANVENAILTGTLNLSLTGSASGNALTGNAGSNSITGGGGTDTMTGGNGNDSYVVDDATDTIVETSTGGTADRVISSIINLNLASYANVENIALSGAAALNATGNAGANVIIGNAGANSIFGGGGADKFTGGSAADIFVYTSAADSTSALQDFFNDFNTASSISSISRRLMPSQRLSASTTPSHSWPVPLSLRLARCALFNRQEQAKPSCM